MLLPDEKKINNVPLTFFVPGGIGEAVAAGLSEYPDIRIKRLAVREVPRSGKPAELMDKYGISASSIKKAVSQMVSLG